VTPGRQQLRRLAYSCGCLLWLAILSLPLLVFVMAVRGEMQWQRGEFVNDRLWLIRETDERGLGFSSARVISNQEAVDGPICVRTKVYFLLWRGSAEPVAFCECYAAGTHEPVGNCEPEGG
jgi:hypothetical protein